MIKSLSFLTVHKSAFYMSSAPLGGFSLGGVYSDNSGFLKIYKYRKIFNN